MTYETILFELNEGVARLTLNRPDRLNSFTVQMHGEIASALDQVEQSGTRVLLITGAGRGFCAGQDLTDRAVAPGSEKRDLGESLELRYNPLIKRIVALKMPVVCAVNGVAAGAGANIALAADIVLAAKSASFIQSFAAIGLVPDSGGSWILPRLVGQARALALAMTGQKLSAEQAESWGMIWRAVDDAALMDEARGFARRLASGPTKGLGLAKQALNQSLANDLYDQLAVERELQVKASATEDCREGIAAFLAKRPPAFTGR